MTSMMCMLGPWTGYLQNELSTFGSYCVVGVFISKSARLLLITHFFDLSAKKSDT